jgi:hypothetical protein
MYKVGTLINNSIQFENRAGFHKNHSTTDHIFVLHMIIELFKISKKQLFCAFIDNEKAFDSVWRVGLGNKILLNGNIDGKCFRIINNMYNGIKAQIKFNGDLSETFSCQLGVRQGENLSPFLFSMYLNDLESFFETTKLRVYNTFPNCS